MDARHHWRLQFDAVCRKDRQKRRSERVEFFLGIPNIEDLDLAVGLERDVDRTSLRGSRAGRVELLDYFVVLVRRESTVCEIEPLRHNNPLFRR